MKLSNFIKTLSSFKQIEGKDFSEEMKEGLVIAPSFRSAQDIQNRNQHKKINAVPITTAMKAMSEKGFRNICIMNLYSCSIFDLSSIIAVLASKRNVNVFYTK